VVTFGALPGELRPSHGCLLVVTVCSAVIVVNVAAVALVLLGYCWQPAELNDPEVITRLFGDPVVVFGSALLSQLVFLSAVPLAMRLSGCPADELLALRPVRPVTLGLAAVGLLCFSLAGDFLIALVREHWPDTASVLVELAVMVRGLPLLPQFLAVVGISLLPAIGEEALFRGVLFTAFLRRWGPVATVAVTALLFGGIHLDPLQSPAAILLGAYLGLLRLRTGSLWPAVVAHGVNNLVAMMLAVANAGSPPGPFAVWATGGLLLGLLALLLLRPADEH